MNKMLLTDYLADNISKRDMYHILRQVAEALLDTEGKDRQVVLDPDEMELLDGKLELQYQNAVKPVSISRIADFMKEIIFRCVFRHGEEVEDLADFLRFLDNEREVTLPYIYEYILDELDMDIPAERQKYYNQRQAAVQEDLPREGETGVLDVRFWQQKDVLQDADKIQKHSQRLTPAPSGQDTGLLDESFWEQKMQHGSLGSSAKGVGAVETRILLVKEKTGEETPITKNTFVVGKDPQSSDLVISNKTISRRHAEITMRGSHYFVKDLGSTNKTFVNDREIPPNVNTEIFSGSKIKFSNEIYHFMVK